MAYGYDEMMLGRYLADMDRQDAEDDAHELQVDEWRQEFRDAVMTGDVNTETGFKSFPKLIDVWSEACAENDDTVFKEAFQALMQLANKGQPEAQHWIGKLEDRYVEYRENF